MSLTYVTVPSGAGLLGSFVVEELEARGYADVFVPRSDNYDLRDADDRLYRDVDPDAVVHLAATEAASARTASTPASTSTITP